MGIDEAGMGLVTVPLSLVADLQDELMTAGTELDRLQRLLIDAVTQLSAHFSNAVNSQVDLPPSQEREALLTDMRRAMTSIRGYGLSIDYPLSPTPVFGRRMPRQPGLERRRRGQ